jgi:hypothetical protein
VDKQHEFFSSQRREEYERGQTVISTLGTAAGEGLATDPMRTALAEYEGRSRDRELLDYWPQVHGLLIAALNDLRDLYTRLHLEADESYRRVVTRLDGYATGRSAGSDAGISAIIEGAKHLVCSEVDGLTSENGYRCGQCRRDLATLIHAPLAAQRLEDRLVRQIDEHLAEQVASKHDGHSRSNRKVRTIRIAEVIDSRRIRNLTDWEAVRDRLDGAVRAALTDGDEVELR